MSTIQLKAIIIEDEKNGQKALLSLLELFCPQLTITGLAENINDALALIQNQQPDIVFLDIILGKENGFDLLEQLPKIDFQIIFTTSSDSHALNAFEANAIGYLMKPIEPDKLVKAVKKAQDLVGTEVIQERYAYLLKSLHSPTVERLSITSRNDGIAILEVQNIVYIQGDGSLSTFFMLNGDKIHASYNLGHYHSLLSENDFYRTHQSYLVNIKFVKRVLPSEGLVELQNGQQVSLAKSRKEGLLCILGV